MRAHSGRLIVIEGVDGSGKETQSARLYKSMAREGQKVMQVAYPRYDQDSSAMVRHYLNGDFGEDPDQVSPYVASTFYAADRYASYKEELEPFLKNGGTVIADRYTTANMVHQAGKIGDARERQAFLDWLTDYEFCVLGLPRPDLVFFLDMPLDVGEALIADRANKMTGAREKDIHESHPGYLAESYTNARQLVTQYGWTRINCVKNGQLRSIEDIHREIADAVRNAFDGR
ncbi:MAG: thymidylate kinase [Eubacteriaceae bacterium]|nr:thymidylate kinase [Eubacteriaceae bacterium]MDD4507955.1 thymidylate kinase [Eubacteriaceae bacterium]